MSTKLSTVNTFQKGLHTNIDDAQVSKQAYTHSLNGRIRQNTDGNYAWENAKGTKYVFNLAADYGAAQNYEPIGQAYINGKLAIISTNGTNNEIGMVTEKQFGTFVYSTLFNDKYDPNGDNLRLSIKHNIRANGLQENNKIERIYFNDDYNEPRQFNLLAGVPFNYAPPYPSWYSVHGIASAPDLTWGLMKYVRTIGGNKKSGRYQYFYRYVHQTGYKSAWSPGCAGINLSAKSVDASNWTNYDMGQSGAITTKGIELEIKYLDQRFQEIEVAALYWQTDTAADSATIIFRGTISGPSITILDTSSGGTPISIDELTQRYFSIKQAKAQAMSMDNYYHLGNLVLYENLEINTAGITVEPYLRPMISDQLGAVDTLPLTHQAPKNTTVTKQLMGGAGGAILEQYVIDQEYINYKGTQWEHLFRGYFREERYPLGIVVFDRKGQPMFAQHISDFTFPEQYSNVAQDARLTGTTSPTFGNVGDYVVTDYTPSSGNPVTDTINQGNNIVLKTLGMKVGNIDLTSILFDANGDLQISGFMIVRMDRIASIITQGLLCNTVRNSTDECNYTDETRPLPSAYNYLKFNGANPTGIEIGKMQNDCAINARGYFHTFESPDYFFDPNIFLSSATTDQMKLVGAVYNSYATPGLEDFITELTGAHSHYYSKNYQTQVSGWDSILDGINEQVGVSGFGNTYPIDGLFSNAIDIDGILGSLFWRQYSGIKNYLSLPTGLNASAIAHRQTLLLNIGGFVTSSIKINNHHVSYYIGNYKRAVASPAITESLLQNRVYNNIGHFVPVNATTVAAAYDAGAGTYIFNDIEVWGGDCFLDYFGLARLLPGYFEPGYEKAGDCSLDPKPDYSIGLMFPIEAKYNSAMRAGNSYPRYATQPFATYCGEDTVFQQGSFYVSETDNRFEDFNVNAVLQQKDLIALYNANKDKAADEINDFPLMEIYSKLKYYGEKEDSFRKFLVNNFQFAKGEYGEIIDMQFLPVFNSIYVFQRDGFCRMRFNDRQFVNTDNGDISTGSGQGYQGHDYISTNGTQHQWSVVNTSKALYWMNAERGKMLSFGQNGVQELSEAYDLKDLTYKLRDYWQVLDPGNVLLEGYDRFYDNPSYLGGVHGVFDYKNNCVVFTFTKRRISNAEGDILEVGDPETIEYSEDMNVYTTYHSFAPKYYLQMNQSYFSCNPLVGNLKHQVHQHDEGIRGNIYGNNYNSILRFTMNEYATKAKVVDNAELFVHTAAGAARLNKVDINTNIIALQSVILNNANIDSRPTYREGKLTYPTMQQNQRERLRGEYAIFEYEVSNDGSDTVARLTGQETFFRISHKV